MSYSGCFGCIFGHKFGSSSSNGLLLVNRMIMTVLNHVVNNVFVIFEPLFSKNACLLSYRTVINLLMPTLILLRSSLSSCICPLLRVHLSLHLSSHGGSRRFTTSDTSTDITKAVSGYNWRSTRKDTSSEC